ncbi:DUF5908 family protein [Roseateles sp. DB2]|uniref:DUF5908 family protein n=1 Tax=Roseateles sp. DB2 TaxID=3453717 RepID=UPI003EF06A4F
MSLEVRQLVLKATVAEDGEDADDNPSGTRPGADASALDAEQLKQEILAACRQWFQEALRQQRER